MRKTFLLALMAAAAIVPSMASAQDRDRDHGHGRGGDQSANSGQSRGGDRGGWRNGNGGGRNNGGAATPAPAPAPAPRFNGGGNNGGGNWRGFRGGQGGTPNAVVPNANGGNRFNGGNGNGGWRGYRGGGGNGGAVAPAPQYNGAPQRGSNPNWRGGDNRPDRNWQGGRSDNRNWGGNNNWRGGDNRGGNWNRNWRGSDRYDWQRYRSYNRNAYHLPRYYAPYGWSYGYRRFSVGVILDSMLFNQSYWIDDPYDYRLPDVYGPYRWVRYYNDALLVDVYSGQVVDVVYGIFW